ncbi:MAG: RNA methyltransferase [Bacteroidales bacterium]|nr:RNA methyltransferase [Bacteroidales bacterium]
MLKIKEQLTSAQNAKIKNLIQLQKPRHRRELGLFVIEGRLEIERALAAGYQITSVFFCPEMISPSEVEPSAGLAAEIFSITPELYEKITYRGSTGGVVATARQHKHTLDGLVLKENPLLIVLESVEKPGNLGAILRTADAAGVDAVIVCDPQTDIYNPNVIRSSIGCLFTVPVFTGNTTEVIELLKTNGIAIFCTALTASVPYQTIDFKEPSAIVMGTESTGLSSTWLDHSTQNIIIPMRGMADSLNVSTTAAIVVFEARRQRGFRV